MVVDWWQGLLFPRNWCRREDRGWVVLIHQLGEHLPFYRKKVRIWIDLWECDPFSDLLNFMYFVYVRSWIEIVEPREIATSFLYQVFLDFHYSVAS